MRVVVGVDGSVESLAALDWAAHLVGGDGAVLAVSAVTPALELAVAAVQADSGALLERTRARLESDWTAAVRPHAGEVTCRVVEAEPAVALLDVAAETAADLVVVGVHAKPALAPRTVGRVTTRLIHLADRPVAIVDGTTPPIRSGSTVVAGVGRGIATDAAVRWAAAYADRHETSLGLVKAVPNRPVFGVDGLLDVAAYYIDPELLVEWALDDLVELADTLQEATSSDLAITASVGRGSAGARLVEAGGDASLLVVGRHAGRQDGTARIQPALHHVITHAPCPVVVVPPPPG